ncbi:hypothetical protein FXN63_11480 [Pigmentiphaga aceris]|uniref:Uncharacterized protein n=1 Tax=Pigmentiphaga aceris TaxID=1940612 RepID=A0A5C0AY80_9BURK|nr:hypothetical protein [Pigmentiphaga aceris]QEI06383.1 hypothetical protein FXN63_11480 [Pigmentiphaga aceris]
MSATFRHERAKFHVVMAACGGFVLLMLAALVYVCTRPQTAEVQAAEAHAVRQCWTRSTDPDRSAISRSAQHDACREMQKQYVYKFGERP